MSNNNKSLPLSNYNFSTNGAYFITILTQDRTDHFGEIVNGEMILNDAGRMVKSVWNDLHQFHPNIDIDESIIMPNHFHGVVIIDNNVETAPHAHPEITDSDSSTESDLQDKHKMHQLMHKMNESISENEMNNSNNQEELADQEQSQRARTNIGVQLSLSNAINQFKSYTTHQYSTRVKLGLVLPLNKELWQDGYHDHIIRNETEYIEIREYIINNTSSWESDRFTDDPNLTPKDQILNDDDWRGVC